MDGIKVWRFLWGMDIRAAVIIGGSSLNPPGPFRQGGDVMFWPCNHFFEQGLAWMARSTTSTLVKETRTSSRS